MTTDQYEFGHKYPLSPGYKQGSTSKEAARAMAKDAPSLRAACLAIIKELGPHTADEVAEALGQSVLSIRPRITELLKMRKIKDSGFRRNNNSKKSAIVWEYNNEPPPF